MPAFSFPQGLGLFENPMVGLGLLILVALVAGEGTARWLRAPRIVGYTTAGMALGAMHVVPAPPTETMRLVTELCLGVVLFELGARIDLGWLRRAPWLAALAIAESVLVGACLYLVLSAGFGLDGPLAACGAAIGISTSPAVVMRVARDLGAQGQVTERMLMLSATNTAVAVIALSGLIPESSPADHAGLLGQFAQPIFVLVGSLAVAGLLAAFGVLAFRVIGSHRESQLIGALGLVLIAAGLAASLQLSIALVLLTLGAGARCLDRDRHMMAVDFGRAGQLFYLLLFALVGASLDLRGLLGVTAAALAFVAVRAAAKGVAVLAFARPTRQPLRKAALLALTLQPMSGLAVVLAQDAALGRPELASAIVPTVLASVVVLELLGAIGVQAGLRLAGEANPVAT